MAEKFSYADDAWQPAHAKNGIRIRLVELAPAADFGEALECRIFWTSLTTSAVPFTALSYTWGSNLLTNTIIVNGKELGITASLDAALRHLRQAAEAVVLWIDQLSIDQSNDAEKSEQVGCMGDIYTAAGDVLLWLGPAADNSEAAMNVFNEVGKAAEDWGMLDYDTGTKAEELVSIMTGTNAEHSKYESYAAMAANAVALFEPDAIQAMAAWYKRAWFTRVWVVQEFCLARTAIYVCGIQRVRSEHVMLTKQMFNASITNPAMLMRAFAAMDAFQSLVQDPTAAFTAIRQRRRWFNEGSGTGDSLYQLLKTLYVKSNMKATEPCDTIFSLLSLATDTDIVGLAPDYSMTSQVPTFLAKAAMQLMRAQGDLECLSLAQYPKQYPGLPTWVPDWTSTLRYPFAWQIDGKAPFFAASGKRALEMIHTDVDTHLALKGNIVDTITHVEPPWPEDTHPTAGFAFAKYGTLLSNVQRACNLAATRTSSSPASPGSTSLKIQQSATRRAEAPWRIPIGDIEQSAATTTHRATPSQQAIYAACLKQIAFQQLTTPLSAEETAQITTELEPMQWATSQYYARMDAMQAMRVFVTDTEALVGMAPAHVEVGDVVVLLYGAAVPFVLRPVAETQGAPWRFVGECYCDGIMDGEGLDVERLETFVIA